MKTKILISICIGLLISACQDELSPTDIEPMVAEQPEPTELTDVDTTITTRISGSWNIDLTGFQYVYQSLVPTQWNQSTKYALTGTCKYPVYTGSLTTTTMSTNLCGPASLLMALSMVPHSSVVSVPSTTTAKATRLATFAKRYQQFTSSYTFGGYTSIVGLRSLANGSPYVKGEFTNWGSCSVYQNAQASILSSQPNSTTGRTAIKDFIRSQIQLDRPIVAIVTVNPSVANADLPGYFSTSGGIGHMVVVVGVTEKDESNYYRVRFKDPLSNTGKTFEANYTTFLNSMVVYNTNYNALAVKGL